MKSESIRQKYEMLDFTSSQLDYFFVAKCLFYAKISFNYLEILFNNLRVFGNDF